MEDYINLYHQKLWEIAFGNVVAIFLKFLPITVFLLLIVIFIYISLGIADRRKKDLLLITCLPFVLFIIAIVSEAVYSYDKIMKPDPSEQALMFFSIKYKNVIPILEREDLITLASVDGELKREDVLFFAVSNPTYYDGLFADPAMSLTGKRVIGKKFPIAVVGYEENDGTWQSADIRIAPGDEEKDFQKFSKVLHIEREESDNASSLLYSLRRLYEMENERKPKNN